MDQVSRRIVRKTAQYDINIKFHGAIGVAKWLPHCRPTYPVIESVTQTHLVLDDGTTLRLPYADWLEDAVLAWNKTKVALESLSMT